MRLETGSGIAIGLGAIQVLRTPVTQMGVGGVKFSGKNLYKDVMFNVISVTRGWVGVKFPGKKRYVTFEWPPVTAKCCEVNYNLL